MCNIKRSALYICDAPKLEVITVLPDNRGNKMIYFRINGHITKSQLREDRKTGQKYFRADKQAVYVDHLRKVV